MDQDGNDLGRMRRRLAAGSMADGGLESTGEQKLDLTDVEIDARIEQTRADLDRVMKALDGDAELLAKADAFLANDGVAAVKALRTDVEPTKRRQILDSLEVIARTDGSRPSFVIRDDMIVRESSPLGTWGALLNTSEATGHLTRAIRCVGRVDTGPNVTDAVGTATLIQDNLIMTNRHVLQTFGKRVDGKWQFSRDTFVDFGREFRGRESLNRRRITGVTFAADPEISFVNPVDHRKVDLVLLELEPTDEDTGQQPLAVALDDDWADPGAQVWLVGYPGRPKDFEVDPPTLFEQLFSMTFGKKRLAPGEVEVSRIAENGPAMAHDTTTLGGNSGSALLVIGQENSAAGIHYGGSSLAPRENWGHVIGKLLDTPDAVTGHSLSKIFVDRGVATTKRA